VRDALRAPGEALDPATRTELEGELGRELGGVRIHRDATAARSADALDALAYTTGSRIVFGPGRYAPDTSEGHRLLSHELAHVIQQRDASRIRAGVSRADDVFERAASGMPGFARSVAGEPPAIQRAPKTGAKEEAPPTMEVGGVKVVDPAELKKTLAPAELVKSTVSFFDQQHKIYSGVKTAAGSDAYLGQLLRLWKRTLEVAIETVHDKLSNDAALTAQLTQAYAGAMGVVLPVWATSLKQTMHELLQAHRDDIHEWGWPASQAESTADTLSGAIPLGDRKRIKVQGTDIIPSASVDVKDLFSTKGGTTTVNPPEGVTAEFSGGVDAKLQRGLSNVAGMLTRRMTPPPLVLDSTLSLALDLGKFGGDYGMYRFTYFTQHAARKPAAKRLLIERLGALGMEGITPSAAVAAQARFTKHGFTFTGSWKDEEREAVLSAVSLTADSQLSPVDGMKFRRQSDDSAHPTEAGNYDPDKHVINLFDRAFNESGTRFGLPGQQVVGFPVYTVAHEIGHAIDYRAYRKGNADSAAATAALLKEFGQFESPPGSQNFQGVPNAQVPRLNALLRAQTRAQDAADKPKTESGHTLKAGTLVTDPRARTAFRDAVKKDGGVRPTPYSDDSWEEAFAESWALYTTEPDTLLRQRPAVSAFFTKRFPR
jgi:hypothetical protein